MNKQVDIKRSTYRVLHQSPGHTTYGIWINGGKCGDLVLRNDEIVAFEQMLQRAGFEFTTFPHMERLVPLDTNGDE